MRAYIKAIQQVCGIALNLWLYVNSWGKKTQKNEKK